MRITFILADSFGCGYFRAIVPGKALREKGHEVHFINDWRDPNGVNCDVLVMQRQDSQEAINAIGVARSRGIKVVHEFDDSFHVLPTTNPNYKVYRTGSENTKKMETVCRMADALIVSTPRLREEYVRFNPNAHICYNAINDSDLKRFGYNGLSSDFKREGQIRIGFAGSDTHRGDFSMIVKPLIRIFDEFTNVRMVFVGADMRTMFPLEYRHCDQVEFAGITTGKAYDRIADIETKDLATQKYYDLIHRSDFDIAVAPIESTSFNAQKSALKEMEYGMLGIPSIASNFGPYRQYVKEASDRICLLADDEKQWYRHIKALIEDASLRESLIRANLEYVKSRHLISDRVEQWERVFESLLKKNVA
jgi:glycosyltransferase involved in cell wall biosynthesis